MKRNIQKPEKKGFGLSMVIGFWGLIFLVFLFSPKKQKEQLIEMAPIVKVDTLYLESKIQPKEKEVASEPTTQPKKEEKVLGNSKSKVDKYAYAGRSYGYDIRNLNRTELKAYLEKYGFRNLKNANLFKLRRIWMAFNYDDMLMNVHYLTDFPISMIYSFFIIEATNKGIETNLWRIHANAGGGKAIKGFGTVTYNTREVIKGKNKMIKDKFYSASSTELGIEAWARILNSGRYYDCKKANYKLPKKDLYESICKCVYESGYHTDPKYKFRAEFMAEYWEIKTKNFPIEEF
jgi:hypothetical protein